MPRSLIDTYNEAGADAGLPQLSTIFRNAKSANSRRIISAANDAILDLTSREHVWTGMWRTAEVIPVGDGSATEYLELPEDVDRVRADTFFTKSQGWYRPQGPVNPGTWALYQNYPISPVYPVWRIQGNKIALHRPISGATPLTFEYVSTHNVGTTHSRRFRERFADDTDFPMVDDQAFKLTFKWRLMKAFGEEYAVDYQDAESYLQRRMAQDGGAPILSYGSRGSDLLDAGVAASSTVLLG